MIDITVNLQSKTCGQTVTYHLIASDQTVIHQTSDLKVTFQSIASDITVSHQATTVI